MTDLNNLVDELWDMSIDINKVGLDFECHNPMEVADTDGDLLKRYNGA